MIGPLVFVATALIAAAIGTRRNRGQQTSGSSTDEIAPTRGPGVDVDREVQRLRDESQNLANLIRRTAGGSGGAPAARDTGAEELARELAAARAELARQALAQQTPARDTPAGGLVDLIRQTLNPGPATGTGGGTQGQPGNLTNLSGAGGGAYSASQVQAAEMLRTYLASGGDPGRRGAPASRVRAAQTGMGGLAADGIAGPLTVSRMTEILNASARRV